MESHVNGDYQAVKREKQGQQDHEASVHRKGRTNACHLPGTSDVLLWGLPISRQLSVSLPSYSLRCEKYRMLYYLNAFPSVPPKPHSRQPSLRDAILGVANREVSQSAAMSFSEARPQSMRWQKRTAPTTKPSAMR